MENWKYLGMELINQKVDPTPSWINPSETFHSKSNRPPPFISRKASSIRRMILRQNPDRFIKNDPRRLCTIVCIYTMVDTRDKRRVPTPPRYI